MSTWATRVKSRMKALDMTQEILARKMGVTRGAITHYLTGRRVPPLSQFQKLAATLKVDPAWLQFGVVTPDKKIVGKKDLTKNLIPILSWEQTAELVDITKIGVAEIKEWLPHFYTDQPRWFALRIKGDAMTAPLGHSKSFHEGDIIIVDPEKPAKHGSYVIVLLSRTKEATFKQYVVDGGVRYLKPLNPQYPMTEIDDSTHVCGVVVRCSVEFP
jgi:SOS-response transcriptional repressor LexA